MSSGIVLGCVLKVVIVLVGLGWVWIEVWVAGPGAAGFRREWASAAHQT
jgi:hypothetical protein